MPEAPSAEFVAAMEHVLDVYHRPYDSEYPVVCMDEASKQLIAEVRQPLPAQPGRTAKYDSEYERRGTANFYGGGTVGWKANGASNGSADENRLGTIHLPSFADGLCKGDEGGACDGQLEHAWNRQFVRSL